MKVALIGRHKLHKLNVAQSQQDIIVDGFRISSQKLKKPCNSEETKKARQIYDVHQIDLQLSGKEHLSFKEQHQQI